jgi:5-methylcytosine-specific restriction enzyme A
MPTRPPIFHPTGKTRVEREAERKAQLDRNRPSPAARGYDRDWDCFRHDYLRDFPICQWPGCQQAATEVHHLERIRLRPELRLHRSNVRGYCKGHHSSVTATEDSFRR